MPTQLKERGVWHLANQGEASWAEFARRAARAAGLDSSLVEACPMASLALVARRPLYSALTSERGLLLPALDDALSRYLRECEMRWPDQAGESRARERRAMAATSSLK